MAQGTKIMLEHICTQLLALTIQMGGKLKTAKATVKVDESRNKYVYVEAIFCDDFVQKADIDDWHEWYDWKEAVQRYARRRLVDAPIDPGSACRCVHCTYWPPLPQLE